MNCLLVEQEELHMAEVSSRLSRAVPVCQVVTVQVHIRLYLHLHFAVNMIIFVIIMGKYLIAFLPFLSYILYICYSVIFLYLHCTCS